MPGAYLWLWNGSAWVKALGDAAGHLQVDVVSGAALESRVYGLDTTWQAVHSELIDATFTATKRGLVVASAMYVFDGTNWRRALAFQSNADAQVTTAYSQRVQAYLYAFNGTTWDRVKIFSGNVYSKTMTMSDDNATRFEATAKKLRDVVIIVKTHPMLLGETGVEVYPVGVNETVGFTKVDISTLYFKNAGAGNNGVITILGTEE